MNLAPEPLERLAGTVSHLMWSATAGGILEYANAAWFRVVGGAPGTDVTIALAGKLHPEDRPRRAQQWLQALRLCETYELEYRLQAASGSGMRWYLEQGTPLRQSRDMGLAGWAVIATPIDRGRRVEEELRATLRSRDDFLATLSHELRNPLAPITSALDLLERNGRDGATVEIACATIRRQLQQVRRLVEDLLDVSRASRGRLELHPCVVDLERVMEIAVESARTVSGMRRQEVAWTRSPQPIQLVADPVRLVQVLTNLLINASKYTPPGGHIFLSAGEEDAAVWIRVRDDGIGIAPDKLKELFQPFTQAAPASPESGDGLGVGLALCRQLIELHGGTISAHSEGSGRGTEFVVRMPRSAARAVH